VMPSRFCASGASATVAIADSSRGRVMSLTNPTQN
jgi:hypothetical protein